jgi:competence protein ComEA
MKRGLILTLLLLSLGTGFAEAKARPQLSLNTATSRQLRTLPGIGELLAQRIIAHRPFTKLWELREIKGIGEDRYKKLIPYISL